MVVDWLVGLFLLGFFSCGRGVGGYINKFHMYVVHYINIFTNLIAVCCRLVN